MYKTLQLRAVKTGQLHGGQPGHVVEYCLAECVVVFCDQLMEELLRALKLQAKAPHKWMRAMRVSLEKICEIVSLDDLPDVARDPKDNHMLAAAVKAGCMLIITGDQDLLALHPYNHVGIITSKQFSEMMKLQR